MTPTIIASTECEPIFYQFLTHRMPEGWHLNDGTARFIGYVNLSSDRQVELDDILCVTAVNRWTPGSCEVTVATNPNAPHRASREYIAFVFDTIFNTWGKSHITSHVAIDNERSLVGTRGLGFKELARLEDFRGEGLDSLLFAMTKKDWLASRWSR